MTSVLPSSGSWTLTPTCGLDAQIFRHRSGQDGRIVNQRGLVATSMLQWRKAFKREIIGMARGYECMDNVFWLAFLRLAGAASGAYERGVPEGIGRKIRDSEAPSKAGFGGASWHLAPTS